MDQITETFLKEGAITIDTPLTQAQIDGALAAIDRLLPFQEPKPGEKPRYRGSLTCSYYEPELVEIIQHPFFEEIAQRVLGTEQVFFYQTAIVTAYPEPGKPWSFEQHVDIQYRLPDFYQTPRQIVCSFFLWLTDVNERRAPMMLRPRSHLLLAEENERQNAGPDVVGRVRGVALDLLPQLDYADAVPLTAKAGQVSVLTTAAVHGASVNVDDQPRKSMVITFTAEGVDIGLKEHEVQQKRDYDAALRPLLRPERQHIITA